MDLRQLRETQAPIKDRYRAEPAAARITLHAKGTLDGEDIVCSIDTGRALVEAGLH
ncbi:MAG: OsmC family peroxiredoxin, partial [Actinomycetota bacterium]|nr:OsmC family peroxiredoxin [Actinomycetota bacterium]